MDALVEFGSAGEGNARRGDRGAESSKGTRTRRGCGSRGRAFSLEMIQPSFKKFRELAREGNLVPVYETIRADLLTPVSAYLRLAGGAEYACMLESVEGGEKIARYTFIGANPSEIFRFRNGVCIVESAAQRRVEDAPPIDFLRKLVTRYQAVRVPGLPPLVSGAIGYFAYDMVRQFEKLPDTGRDDVSLDDAVMMFFLGLVVFDHVQHRLWIVRNVFTGTAGSLREKYDAAIREIAADAKTSGAARRARETQPRAQAIAIAEIAHSAHRFQFLEARVSRGRSQIEGIHSRGRRFSGGDQPAILHKNRV